MGTVVLPTSAVVGGIREASCLLGSYGECVDAPAWATEALARRAGELRDAIIDRAESCDEGYPVDEDHATTFTASAMAVTHRIGVGSPPRLKDVFHLEASLREMSSQLLDANPAFAGDGMFSRFGFA